MHIIDKRSAYFFSVPHRGKGRAIHPEQTIHISVAFKHKAYRPKANFIDKTRAPEWKNLVGHNDESVSVPRNLDWKDFLEMDLFDTDAIKLLGSNPNADDITPILQRLAFMAASGRFQQYQCSI